MSCKQDLTRWVYRPAMGRCCPSPPLGCPPGGCWPLREAARARCAGRPCCCRPPLRATFQESLKTAAIQCSKLVFTDPNPAFQAEYQSGSGSRVLTTKNRRKKLQIFFKTTIYLFLRPPLRTSQLQKRPSALKREHPALQT